MSPVQRRLPPTAAPLRTTRYAPAVASSTATTRISGMRTRDITSSSSMVMSGYEATRREASDAVDISTPKFSRMKYTVMPSSPLSRVNRRCLPPGRSTGRPARPETGSWPGAAARRARTAGPSRQAIEEFRSFVERMPEALSVFVLTGADDVLITSPSGTPITCTRWSSTN